MSFDFNSAVPINVTAVLELNIFPLAVVGVHS